MEMHGNAWFRFSSVAEVSLLYDFVFPLLLKYQYYMVRFVLETIKKTKREKNHSI